METEHEGKRFRWNYDSRMGVGNFERKSDGAISFLETGSDCVAMRRYFNRLKTNTGSVHYPSCAPSFADLFDVMAMEYEYV